MRRALPLLLLIGCGTGPGPEPTPTPLGDPLPACDEAEPGFDSIRASSGVDFVSEAGEGVEVGGLVFADLDGDGPSDLLFFQRLEFEGGDGEASVFWGNGDGTFEPHDGPLPDLPNAFGAATGDVDSDGDLDVLLFGGDVPELWLTDGRAFEDAGEAWGLQELEAGEGSGGTLGDVDGDGDLDLLVHDGLALEDRGPDEGPLFVGPPNRLYRNAGDRFEPWPGPWEATPGITHHAWLHDADRDGDLDILSLHDGGNFGNNSEHWEQTDDGWTVHAGFGVLENPMGGLLEDLDRDGADDLITTDIGAPRIFSGDDAFGWIDVGLNWMAASEHGSGDTSWSVLPLDANLDGRTDLFVTYGMVLYGDAPPDVEFPEHQPDRLFLDAGEGDVPRFVSVDGVPPNFENNARGAASDDLDGDGMPDVVVRNILGPPSILRGRCVGDGRLAVEIRDEGSADPFALGAEVTVHSAAGVQRRRVGTDQGTYSGTSPRLFFGVGDAERVDRIVVRWPDGGEDEWTDVCVPCRVRLERP